MTHQEEVEKIVEEIMHSVRYEPLMLRTEHKIRQALTTYANARVRECVDKAESVIILDANEPKHHWYNAGAKEAIKAISSLSPLEETTSDWKNSEDRKKLIDAADKAGAVFRRTMGEESNNTSV